MSLVCFGDSGYSYCAQGRYVSFEEDNKHELLFQYVSKDISWLPALLENYIAQRMDITSYTLKGYTPKTKDDEEIFSALRPLHRYFEHESRKALVNAIGHYFNALIIRTNDRGSTDFTRIIKGKSHDEWRSWYIERFNALTASLLRSGENYSEAFFGKHIDMVGPNANDPLRESFIINIEEARGFLHEVAGHSSLKRILFWILDSSVPSLEALTLSQRIWLYGNMHSIKKEIEVKKPIPIGSHGLFSSNNELEGKDNCEWHKYYQPLQEYGAENFHEDYNDASPDMIEAVINAVNYAKKAAPTIAYDEYYVDSLYQLLYLEVLSMMRMGTSIRKCKHCGVYFVSTDKKKAYCDRVKEGEAEPCSIIGPQRLYQMKIKSDYPLKIYNRAYKTRHARIKYKKISMIEFQIWSKEAKERLDQVRNGSLDISDFSAWLKKE